jgi:hypothetical protein
VTTIRVEVRGPAPFVNPITPILSTGKPGIRPTKRFVVEGDHLGTIVFETWDRTSAKR